MAELMEAYQRTHETMGTIAKNVGNNNKTIVETTDRLESMDVSLEAQRGQLKTLADTLVAQQKLFNQINEITDKLTTIVRYQQERLDGLTSQVEVLRTEAVKMYKRIFWYMIVVIVLTGSTFVYGLSHIW